jgi:invasion protein IalB
MTIRTLLAAVATVALLSAGAAHAQAAKEKPAAAAKAPRTAKSLECSKEADAKSLHGSPRKKFMRTCKKG